MASSSTRIPLLLFLLFPSALAANEGISAFKGCGLESGRTCYDKPGALRLKLIAIFTILVASLVGVCLPLVSRSFPVFRVDGNPFVLVKAFASGVILATGFMHVLPDSFSGLTSECLPDQPWRKFPFTTFIAMLSALLTLSLDSLMTSFLGRRKTCCEAGPGDQEKGTTAVAPGANGHGNAAAAMQSEKVGDEEGVDSVLQRNRTIAQANRPDVHLTTGPVGEPLAGRRRRDRLRVKNARMVAMLGDPGGQLLQLYA